MTITWVGSPNFDSNRKPIDRIVVHWFGDNATASNVISAVDAQFQKTGGTSAHYAVENTTIHQYVKEDQVAYHAGNYPMNQRSIGIEHSGGPNRTITDTTYKTSSQLIADICRRYAIPADRTHIIMHREVKATQCPGTLDIDRLIDLVRNILAPGGDVTDLQRCERDRDYLRGEMEKYQGYFDSLADLLQVEHNYDVVKGEISKLIGYEDKVIEKDKQIVDVNKKLEDLNLILQKLTKENEDLIKINKEMKQQIDLITQDAEMQKEKFFNLTRELEEVKKICNIEPLHGFKKFIFDLFIRGR